MAQSEQLARLWQAWVTTLTTDTELTTEYQWLQKLGANSAWLRDKLLELFAVDLRILALFRIALGALLLFDLIARSRALRVFYSDDGVVPRSAVFENMPHSWFVSLHFLSGRVEVEALMFVISVIFALMLIFGWRTRLASFGSWLLLVSLDVRNPFVIDGADNIFRVLLFWGIFLPWGARYSVESALETSTPKSPTRVFSIGTVALLLQMPIVYLFTGLLKSGSPWRQDFTAISLVLRAPDFSLPLGSWLSSFPTVLKIATLATLLLEIGGAILLLSPWFTKISRLIAISGLVALQVGFLLTMKLGLFPIVSTVGLIPFLPGSCWDRLSGLVVSRKESPLIYYDGDCAFCRKLVALIRGFLVLPKASLLEAQSNPVIYEEMNRLNSWVVVGADNVHRYKFAALAYLVQVSPILWPLGLILRQPPIAAMGDRMYVFVARNRGHGGLALRWLRAAPVRIKQPWILTLLCAFFLAYVVIDNVGSLRVLPVRIPEKLGFIGQLFRVHQHWRMFAPAPPRLSRWSSVEGRLQDGRAITLFDANPVSAANPDNIGTFRDYRWRTYWSWLRFEENQNLRPYAARYFCTTWNQTHAGTDALTGVTLHALEKPINVNGPDEETRDNVILDFDCRQ